MTNTNSSPDNGSRSDPRLIAIIAYALLLAGWPTFHMASVAAVVLSYVQRNEVRGTIWESHFTNVIHTFWVGLIVGVVVVPLCFVLVGVPLLIALLIWVLYRTIKGLVRAIDSKPFD